MIPVDDLIRRINGEFDAAHQQVDALRERATATHHRLKQRHHEFVEAARRIGELLHPRIDAFSREFQNLHQTITLIRQGAQGQEVHGALAVFTLAHTADCPAEITLTFSLGHDESIEQVILTYRLDIIPLFVKFDRQDTLALPIEGLDEDRLVAWFDDRLVSFAKTYMSIFFTPQYQGNNQVPDLVLGITFPRTFAAGSREYGGRTYYFYTEDSLSEFDADPTRFAGPARVEPQTVGQ